MEREPNCVEGLCWLRVLGREATLDKDRPVSTVSTGRPLLGMGGLSRQPSVCLPLQGLAIPLTPR